MVLFGTSDRVIYPDFDRMAAAVFDRCIGPFLLRDCGHFVPWEAPHELVGAVLTLAAAH
jgi:pimeloyl-ACP methyl ester carboxylesterase